MQKLMIYNDMTSFLIEISMQLPTDWQAKLQWDSKIYEVCRHDTYIQNYLWVYQQKYYIGKTIVDSLIYDPTLSPISSFSFLYFFLCNPNHPLPLISLQLNLSLTTNQAITTRRLWASVFLFDIFRICQFKQANYHIVLKFIFNMIIIFAYFYVY